MNFPVWELGMGTGLLVALVSILHVFVSHFAIGGGLFLVITEHLAYRRGDMDLREYLVTHSRFFALVTLVFGALTGVGIWFTVGLASPGATSALIRIFLWGWAIEWTFFVVEIAAALLYYSSWNRLSRRAHLAVGWVYFAAAFLSLVVINGIVTFMLTPGRWIETRSFWDGFFNPTYWPSLAARTAVCVALAGVYALVTGTLLSSGAFRRRLLRYASLWGLAGALLAIPSVLWYASNLPDGVDLLLKGGIPMTLFLTKLLPYALAALLLLLLAALFLPGRFPFPAALVVLAVSLLSMGALEWVREGIRKPYVISGYMYGNGFRVEESEELPSRGGILANALWTSMPVAKADRASGREIFRLACRSCHTLSGYRGLREPARGLDEQYVYALVGRLEHLRGAMPPFPGNETERRALASYLVCQAGCAQAPLTAEAVFRVRCGVCHMQTGFRPLQESLEGYGRDDLVGLVMAIGDMTEAMPPWTGTEREAEQVAGHILGWYGGDLAGGEEKQE